MKIKTFIFLLFMITIQSVFVSNVNCVDTYSIFSTYTESNVFEQNNQNNTVQLGSRIAQSNFGFYDLAEPLQSLYPSLFLTSSHNYLSIDQIDIDSFNTTNVYVCPSLIVSNDNPNSYDINHTFNGTNELVKTKFSMVFKPVNIVSYYLAFFDENRTGLLVEFDFTDQIMKLHEVVDFSTFNELYASSICLPYLPINSESIFFGIESNLQNSSNFDISIKYWTYDSISEYNFTALGCSNFADYSINHIRHFVIHNGGGCVYFAIDSNLRMLPFKNNLNIEVNNFYSIYDCLYFTNWNNRNEVLANLEERNYLNNATSLYDSKYDYIISNYDTYINQRVESYTNHKYITKVQKDLISIANSTKLVNSIISKTKYDFTIDLQLTLSNNSQLVFEFNNINYTIKLNESNLSIIEIYEYNTLIFIANLSNLFTQSKINLRVNFKNNQIQFIFHTGYDYIIYQNFISKSVFINLHFLIHSVENKIYLTDLKISNLLVPITYENNASIEKNIRYTNDNQYLSALVSEFFHSIEIPSQKSFSTIIIDTENLYLQSSNIVFIQLNLKMKENFGDYYLSDLSQTLKLNFTLVEGQQLSMQSLNEFYNNYLGFSNSNFLYSNGGILSIYSSMLTLGGNIEDLHYDLVCIFEHFYSKDLVFDYYFSKALELLLPLILIGIFVWAFYSESNSKYIAMFGFIAAIITFYLIDMLTFMYLILLLFISIFAFFIIVKHEKRGALTN